VTQLFVMMTMTAAPALKLQAEEGNGIPWWVWVILIAVLVVLLLIGFFQQSESGEMSRETEEEMAGQAAEPRAEPAEELREAHQAADDLKRIEGIGPKIASILNEGGISTFAALAAADTGRLQELLDAADIHIATPDTWPEQAGLAAAGRWEELEALQDSLKGGRKQ
jgi:predicted flap endonuclease-1-like 5' DNA nuclease